MAIPAVVKAIGVGISMILGGLLGKFLHKKHHDKPAEEAAEVVLHVVTGEDVDLTPETPEKDSALEDAAHDIAGSVNEHLDK